MSFPSVTVSPSMSAATHPPQSRCLRWRRGASTTLSSACDGAFNMDTAEASQCAALVGAAHSIPYHTKASPADPAFDLEKAMEFQAEGRLLVNMGQEIVLVRDDCGSRRDADREHLPGVGRKHPCPTGSIRRKTQPLGCQCSSISTAGPDGAPIWTGDGRRLP